VAAGAARFQALSASHIAGVAESSVYAALERLANAGVITPITQSKRSRAWVGTEVLDEVDRLNSPLAGTTKTGRLCGGRTSHPQGQEADAGHPASVPGNRPGFQTCWYRRLAIARWQVSRVLMELRTGRIPEESGPEGT
jgi:hypothetical protein